MIIFLLPQKCPSRNNIVIFTKHGPSDENDPADLPRLPPPPPSPQIDRINQHGSYYSIKNS